MRIFCINLDRSVERWASINRQASQLGLSIERFPAIDGSKLNPPPNFPVSPGAIGCFLSHRALWEAISHGRDDYALILEDDALLSPSLPEFLHDTSWLPKDADLVHIGATDPLCSIRGFGRMTKGRKLYLSLKCTGTESYIISKQCASRLVIDMVSIDREFDQILFNGGRPDLKIYKLNPGLATQDRKTFEGLIERSLKKTKLTIGQKLKRELLRSLEQTMHPMLMRRTLKVWYE